MCGGSTKIAYISPFVDKESWLNFCDGVVANGGENRGTENFAIIVTQIDSIVALKCDTFPNHH